MIMIMTMIMNRVDGSYLCPKCELPLCGELCSAGPWHRPECSVFSRSVFTIIEWPVSKLSVAHYFSQQ